MNKTIANNMRAIVSTTELQNQFAKRIQRIEKQIVKTKVSIAKTEELFNGLLQKVFKGELV